MTRPLILVIVLLIALRLALLFGMFYLPHLEHFRHDGHVLTFLTGDDYGYYRQAEMIYRWSFERHPWTFGFPLTEVPFVAFFGEHYERVVFAVVIFNALALYGLATALFVRCAERIFKSVRLAGISGLLFVLFPFLFYFFRGFGPHFEGGNWNDFNFFYANWLAAMSDPLAAFLTLLYFALLITEIERARWRSLHFILGLIAGYAVMTRVSSAFLVVPALTIYFWDGVRVVPWRKVFYYTIGGLIGFAPQLVYNSIFWGAPWHFGYQDEYQAWLAMGAAHGPKFGWENVIHLWARAYHYSPFVILAAAMLLFVIVSGAYFLIKQNKRQGVALALWFILPVVFYMSFTTGQTTFRYYLPAVPAFIILCVASGVWLKELFFRRESQLLRE